MKIEIDRLNKLLDRHIKEANSQIDNEWFHGNQDKVSWWKGARTQAVKFKSIINNE